MHKKHTQNYVKDYFFTKVNIFKFIITVFHLVGLLGMVIPDLRVYFQFLTPFHLLLCTSLLFYFHKDWSFSFYLFTVLAFGLGYGSEVLGVHTGFPFGSYTYGPVLGFQLFEVPLLIGINWLLLVYISGEVFHKKIKNDYLAAFSSAIIMVLLDVLIEPVAVKLDFWSWENDLIPASNFVGWLGVAFLIQLIYRKSNFIKINPLSLYLLFNLAAFFLLLNILL
ncbi:carotenoid biosynthesis protein [Belliella sp. R4-6]|uniref:Carotenoid biosynthesis protein n=1 Tax=Belliella alkalica TaxID=1730871 RepID=A0ABS9V992_9BACT|nr:carotenoid biosynthesis protein [Belliella alkalica]MCH7412979.1 carotenoid biosynthesis protein [Belliella alkalica]